jgi:hypothetical protein
MLMPAAAFLAHYASFTALGVAVCLHCNEVLQALHFKHLVDDMPLA